MDSSDIINRLTTGIITQVYDFLDGDLITLIVALLSVTFIVFAATKIYSILNMSPLEKDAKRAFIQYRYDKGTWREPLSRRKYREALDDIEIDEFERENGER